MKERGMIFNGEMVRAILTAGRRRPGDLSNGNRLGSLKLVSVKTVANGRGAKMQSMLSISGIHVRSVPSAIVSGCERRFRGRYSISTLWIAIAKTQLLLRSQSFVFTRLTACLRQSFTMQMMNCIAAGDHQSTCRAGQAAFCWKSPTCGLSG